MDKRLLLNRIRAINEATMADLSAPVDSGRRDRAKSVQHHFNKVDRNSEGHAVLIWDTVTGGSGHRYKCYISVEPDGNTLFQLAHGAKKLRTAMDLIRNADVKCFCTCKDFKFSGAEYNMKHRHGSIEPDHASRDSSDIVPSVRDPEGKHTLCKHLYSCFNGILTNAPTIMKQAREAKFPPMQGTPRQTLIGQKAADANTDGDLLTMNSATASPDAGQATGSLSTFNGSKAVKEDPGDASAISLLGTSEPVEHTPEVSEALDAIATQMNGNSTPSSDSADGDITELNGAEDEPSDSTGTAEIDLMNSAGSPGGVFDMEDALASGMFNGADEE